MTVTAQDNQYIAGVALQASAAFNTLAITAPTRRRLGRPPPSSRDSSEVDRKHFWLEVSDAWQHIHLSGRAPLGMQPEPPEAFAFELLQQPRWSVLPGEAWDMCTNPRLRRPCWASWLRKKPLCGLDVYGLMYKQQCRSPVCHRHRASCRHDLCGVSPPADRPGLQPQTIPCTA